MSDSKLFSKAILSRVNIEIVFHEYWKYRQCKLFYLYFYQAFEKCECHLIYLANILRLVSDNCWNQIDTFKKCVDTKFIMYRKPGLSRKLYILNK